MSEPDVEQAIQRLLATKRVTPGLVGDTAEVSVRLSDLRALLASHERLRLAVEALRPFAAFAEAFDAKPISGLDDTLYAIHTGTAWAAAFRLSDCRAARAALQQIEAEEPKWLPLRELEGA